MAMGGEPIQGQPFKRSRIDYALETGQLCSPVSFTYVLPRPRLMPLVAKTKQTNPLSVNGVGRSSSSSSGQPAVVEIPRPPSSVHLDDYLTLVGDMYYAGPETGRSSKDWSLLRRTTLGALTSPLREPSVVDKWAPLEIAKFEAALCMCGKQFPVISRLIGTKTVPECVELYYVWKQGKNYELWKRSFKEADKLPDA